MARMPLTKEEVVSTRLVLNLENLALTEEQFFQLCRDNDDFRMELTARKELIIMWPTGLKSNWRETVLSTRLMNWAEVDGTGLALGASGAYTLPNGAVRAPDASWVRRERLAAFSDEELEGFTHICPDFVAEVVSPSDTLAEAQEKMAEYIANGAQLGWLIDPYNARVHVYRTGQAAEC